MEEINYYPNEIARALLNNRTYFVGVIVPTVTSPFHGESCRTDRILFITEKL